MRVIFTALLALIIFAAHSQIPAQQLKLVDSIENVVSTGMKKYLIKKDTGRITTSKNQTASYQKQFYIDRGTKALHMVTYLRMYSNGMLINETYYYLHNKPISVYLVKQARRKSMVEETYYFYNDQTYNHKDSTVLKPVNDIRSSAEGFLAQYRKLK